jgi:ABC-2 type transport system ATP-binding protein
MDNGRIIAQGEPQALLKKHFSSAVITLPAAQFPKHLPTGDDLKVRRRGESVEILSSDLNASIQQLLELNISLDHLQVRSRTLEDLFLELTGHQLRS